MSDDFSGAMRRASDATRAGNLSEATQIMQDALRQKASVEMAAFKPRVPKGRQKAASGGARRTFRSAAGHRDYVLHLPEGGGTPQGLVVMLHGCTQSPEDFAVGTGMSAAADLEGFAVLYPAQSSAVNAQGCWQWFQPGDQRRGAGEAAILAGMAQEIAEENQIPMSRIFVAGLSAGGAMAVILGQTYPEVFSAVGVHSGLPYGVAQDVGSAFAAMGGNLGQVPAGRAIRTIVFHGQSDSTVHPRNGAAIVGAVPMPVGATQLEERIAHASGSTKRTVTVGVDGIALVEIWEVASLGHAWSGGSGAGSYTDPEGPDASAAMLRFFLAGGSAT